MRKNIENFEVMVSDIALARVTRNKMAFVEVALLRNPSLRCLLEADTLKLVDSNESSF